MMKSINISSITKQIKKYQHLKCTLWISIIAIVVLIVSLFVPCSPWASILQNIFAGLVTGIVVTLISSLKGKELKNAEIEDQFLKIVHDLYISSRSEYGEFRKSRYGNNNEYLDSIYELIVELEAIENFIGSKDKDGRLVGIIGKKPSEYFDEEKKYSFSEQEKRHQQLYDLVDSTIQYNEEERKAIDQLVGEIRRAHSALNKKAIDRENEIFEEKIEIETSVP